MSTHQEKRSFVSPRIEELERQRLVQQVRWSTGQLCLFFFNLALFCGLALVLRERSAFVKGLSGLTLAALIVAPACTLTLFVATLGEHLRKRTKERWQAAYRNECLRIAHENYDNDMALERAREDERVLLQAAMEACAQAQWQQFERQIEDLLSFNRLLSLGRRQSGGQIN